MRWSCDLAGEQLLGLADLDALARQEERGAVGQAPRLLHQVGDQDDGDLAACSSLSTSSMRIVVTGSTAIENSSSSSRSGSCDSARAMVRRCCWPPESRLPSDVEAVLDLVPQRRPRQAALDDHVELGLAS